MKERNLKLSYCQCVLFLLVMISGFISAEPAGISLAPPAADPLIQEIQSDYGQADKKIRNLLTRKRQCAKRKAQFLVPEFATLVSNIKSDVECWLEHGQLDLSERSALQWLYKKVISLRNDGYPYENTVYTTARYTLMTTLLHQHRDPCLIQDQEYKGFCNQVTTVFKTCRHQEYRGDPSLTLNDVMNEGFFSDTDYFDSIGNDMYTAPDCLLKGMGNLSVWLADSEIMLYPEHDELSKKDFFQCFPFPFYMLGVGRGPVIAADGYPMSPSTYFSHDLFHTKQMLICWENEISGCNSESFDRASVTPASAWEKVLNQRCILRNKCVAISYFLSNKAAANVLDQIFSVTHEFEPTRSFGGELFWNSLKYNSTAYALNDYIFGYTCLWKFFEWSDKCCVEVDFLKLESAKYHATTFWTQERNSIDIEVEAIKKWHCLYQALTKNDLLQRYFFTSKDVRVQRFANFIDGIITNKKIWGIYLDDMLAFNSLIQEIQNNQPMLFNQTGKTPDFFLRDHKARLTNTPY